jgi:guanylate kinase
VTDCKTAGKIFFVMGKSASGKDTIYKKLLEYFPELKTVTLYTTRPMREGETEGVEYHFIREEQLEAMKSEGRVIEMRTYQTMYGPWSYATVEDGQIDLSQGSYMMIGTLESYESIRTYFGENGAVPIYIEVEDGERLIRAVNREKQQKKPKYTELCRRFLADETDFSEEKLAQAGITAEERYENQELSDCLKNIAGKIEKTIRRYARG